MSQISIRTAIGAKNSARRRRSTLRRMRWEPSLMAQAGLDSEISRIEDIYRDVERRIDSALDRVTVEI